MIMCSKPCFDNRRISHYLLITFNLNQFFNYIYIYQPKILLKNFKKIFKKNCEKLVKKFFQKN